MLNSAQIAWINNAHVGQMMKTLTKEEDLGRMRFRWRHVEDTTRSHVKWKSFKLELFSKQKKQLQSSRREWIWTHDHAIAMHIAPKLLIDEPFSGYSSISVYLPQFSITSITNPNLITLTPWYKPFKDNLVAMKLIMKPEALLDKSSLRRRFNSRPS